MMEETSPRCTRTERKQDDQKAISPHKTAVEMRKTATKLCHRYKCDLIWKSLRLFFQLDTLFLSLSMNQTDFCRTEHPALAFDHENTFAPEPEFMRLKLAALDNLPIHTPTVSTDRNLTTLRALGARSASRSVPVASC